MMPSISDACRARCGEGGCLPAGGETLLARPGGLFQKAGSTDGDTGASPVDDMWARRPACHSCANMNAPLACTDSVMRAHPDTCPSVHKPGEPYPPCPSWETAVPSAMIRPPSVARCV